jgi:hypothetical protein
VVIKTNRSDKTGIKKKIKKSAATSRGGPGPFQGPSSYPQLLVVADCKYLPKFIKRVSKLKNYN